MDTNSKRWHGTGQSHAESAPCIASISPGVAMYNYQWTRIPRVGTGQESPMRIVSRQVFTIYNYQWTQIPSVGTGQDIPMQFATKSTNTSKPDKYCKQQIQDN
jgi:hypothetical protein